MGKINEARPRGEHIPLYCINHPDKRWSTKNIDYIGARSLFYNLHHVPDMGPECDCSIRDLRPLEADDAASTD
jgi:hypothetical protein